MLFKIHNAVRAKYTGLFGFERVMGAHYNALMAAMRHFESVGDDTSLGLVLMALIRGRKPWMMDLRYKYFQSARLERFSEVLIVMFRWVVRNLSVPLDEVRVLLKKLEHHLPHRNKRKKVSEYLYQALEDAGRVADAYDAAHLLMRHDLMGLARKKQMDQAIGRDAADMYRPIDPLAWGRTGRGGRSLLTDADVRVSCLFLSSLPPCMSRYSSPSTHSRSNSGQLVRYRLQRSNYSSHSGHSLARY